MNNDYQICSNCIMDTSDPTLTFDEKGVCVYCNNFEIEIKPNWHPNEQGMKNIMPMIEKIKKEGKGKDYDCLIGLSGGLDSSFVTYVATKKFGLRPLIFHCDAGWNSDLGVSNVQKMIEDILSEKSISQMSQIGQVMGELKKRSNNRADMGFASKFVKEKLS